MTEFHVCIAGKPDLHVMTTHTTGPDDKSPLQIISAERLAELEAIERAAKDQSPDDSATIPA